MKAKDLRLGNYVTDNSGFTMYVVGIYEDTVLLNFEGNEGDVLEVSEDDLKPIALDKEMLLKLGYKIYVSDNGWDRYSKKGIDFHLSPLISGGYIPSFHINGEYHIIKYLHELQNLFYMLKNEELTINL